MNTMHNLLEEFVGDVKHTFKNWKLLIDGIAIKWLEAHCVLNIQITNCKNVNKKWMRKIKNSECIVHSLFIRYY